MKKLLLPIAAVLFSAGINAQTYFSEDFSGGIGTWATTDSDGDGNNWGIFTSTAPNDAFGDCITSASWATNALTPDNWIVSPAIDLTTSAASVSLLWKVYAQDQSWVAENYTVYVATASDIATLGASTTTFTEVLTTSAGFMDRMIDISAFAGQTIYVAFRHHNVTDQFRMNIDDVIVKTVPPNDIELVSLNNTAYEVAGSVSIVGTVKNQGSNAITSFDVDWNDGTAHTATITANIASGATFDFSHPTALTVVGGTDYTMTVCATVTGDADATNNCLDQTIAGMTQSATKYVVGEEKTGTWCGWCPRGAVGLEGMDNTSNFIGVAVHNGDPMTVAAYDAGALPGFTGYPHGAVDRIIGADPSTFSTMHSQRENVAVPVSMGVTASIDNNTGVITVTGTADLYATLNGDYRIAVVLTEDHVTGTGSGYAQVNYYDGGGSGALNGAGHDWTTAGDPVPAADMEYNHVGRALGSNSFMGVAGSVPATNAAGSQVTKTYTFNLDPSWNAVYMHAVAMFVNGTTGEIINAGKTTISGAVGISEKINNLNVSVYPNPTSDFTNVRVELMETSNVTIEVYNTLGKIVYSENSNNIAQGAYYFRINTLDFASGLYTVKTTVNNDVNTTKLSVR